MSRLRDRKRSYISWFSTQTPSSQGWASYIQESGIPSRSSKCVAGIQLLKQEAGAGME